MKHCFKCGLIKPETEFYCHPQMGDGLLGKCKECTKRDVMDRYEIKRKDLSWVMKERERCRAKQNRYRISHPDKSTQSSIVQKNWQKRNRNKRKAEQIACNAVRDGKLKRHTKCELCGISGRIQKHHPDYSLPLKVQWLCTRCHGQAHWKMTL